MPISLVLILVSVVGWSQSNDLFKSEPYEQVKAEYFKYATSQVTLLDQLETKQYENRYNKVKRSLDKLIVKADKKNSVDKMDKKLAKIHKDLDALERLILVEFLITPNRAKLKNLDKRLIPVQYANTERAIAALESLLTNTPKDIPTIAQAKYTMDFELSRANTFNIESKRLKAASGIEFEQIILDYHQQLTKVANAQGVDAQEQLTFQERIKSLVENSLVDSPVP